MAYFKIIEASTTWTCPKSGDYKVICVAAGSSAVYTDGVFSYYNNGGASSFGSLLTAEGLIKASASIRGFSHTSAIYPLDGYTIHNSNYGRYSVCKDCQVNLNSSADIAPSIGTGIGYGAGGIGTTATNTIPATSGGLCGKMKMEIFHLEEGETYAVTVGIGNAGPIQSKTHNSITYYMIPAAGSDGVVIIQEV